MAVSSYSLIQQVDWHTIDTKLGLAKFNESRKIATAIKNIAQVPEPFGGVCPYDMSENRPESRGTHMSDEHSVVYLGNNAHAILVDKDYAVFVYDGANGSPGRPWIHWAKDRYRASAS